MKLPDEESLIPEVKPSHPLTAVLPTLVERVATPSRKRLTRSYLTKALRSILGPNVGVMKTDVGWNVVLQHTSGARSVLSKGATLEEAFTGLWPKDSGAGPISQSDSSGEEPKALLTVGPEGARLSASQDLPSGVE